MISPWQTAIDVARLAAVMSPCQKSKRGAVVFRSDRATKFRPAGNGEIYGKGFNGMPQPGTCDGSETCRERCGKRCVHAEARAIRDTINEDYGDFGLPRFPDLELLHVKVDALGLAVPGGPPSCWQCSREILDVGLDGVWLFELAEQFGRLPDPANAFGEWRRYTAAEFHEATLKNCGLA